MGNEENTVRFKLTILFLLAISFLVTSCSKKSEISENEYKEINDSQEGNILENIEFTGKVKKVIYSKNLSFPIGGNLLSFNVKPGQQVKKGDLIAKLDKTNFELERKKKQAIYAEKLANLKSSLNDYQKALLLLESENITKAELEKSKSLYLSAKASAQAAKIDLEISNKKEKNYVIFSPISGNISSLRVSPEQKVKPGQSVINLITSSFYKVDLEIPLEDASKIKLGEKSSIYVLDIPDRELKGKVTSISKKQCSKSDNVLVTVLVSTLDNRLCDGQEVSVSFNKTSS